MGAGGDELSHSYSTGRKADVLRGLLALSKVGSKPHSNESADLQTLARHDRDWKLGGYKRVLWNPVEAHHLEARHLHHDDAALA